jgi:hypothetical protein
MQRGAILGFRGGHAMERLSMPEGRSVVADTDMQGCSYPCLAKAHRQLRVVSLKTLHQQTNHLPRGFGGVSMVYRDLMFPMS